MDEVLTRKMFKNRYFKTLKPTIKHFQEGGLGSLSPKEKAIYAATLAAPLLQAKGKGLAPALEALGEGVGKLPATILSVEKEKGNLGKPVGPGDLNRLRGFFGKAAGTDYAKQYAGFKTKIDQATIFLTKAVSGAQVSDQERERIKELIPQVGDTERVFEAKVEALEKYLGTAQDISENTGGSFQTAIEIIDSQGGVSQFIDFTQPVGYEKTKSGAIKITTD
jgi:hypothetical protein